MAKPHPLPQHKVITILKKNGFKKARVRKHITMKKKINGKVLTTWIPKHNEVTVFVIKYIARQTGKPIDEFYEK